MIKNGSPSFNTRVGLKVTRGRLPAAMRLACPSVKTKLWPRVLSGMPVSPAITEGSHAPLGVAEKTLPQRSTTFTQVVSLA